MWGRTPFMIMLFIDVTSTSPLLPRGVITRTWSTYRSTGFITWTLNGQLSTETYVDHSEYLTTETVDDQGNTANAAPLPASTTAVAPQASVDNPSPRPTPTPGPATPDNPAPVTPVLSSSSQSTRTSTSTSISTSHSGSRTVQDTILQRIGSASAVSTSSSQDSVAAASQDASEVVGLSKPQFWAVIGSTIAGVALISLLLFVAYLKRKATFNLFCPVKEPADGSARTSMIMRIEPFVQSASLPSLNDQILLTPVPVSTRSSTNLLSSLHSDTSAHYSRTTLSGRPEKESPVPVVAVLDEIVSDDDMRPVTPPPVYTA